MQPQYGEKTDKRVSRTEFYTAILLVVFTMFFVWSCVLALGADGMNEALEQNTPVLSYFANVTDTPSMAYMAPIAGNPTSSPPISATCSAPKRERNTC